MILLLAIGLFVAAGSVAVWRSRTGASGAPLAWAIALAPLLLALIILVPSRERLDDLHVLYAGKRLAFDEETPLTLGGAAGGSAADLAHGLLGPRASRIEIAGEELAETSEVVGAGDPVLRLASPAPMVSVDGSVVNRFRLEDGDRLRFAGVEPAIEIELRGSSLVLGERGFELGGRLASLFRGAQVRSLQDALTALTPGHEAGVIRSFLHRPRPLATWHLVLREEGWTVERGGAEVAAFRSLWPLPEGGCELALEVVWGGAPQRYLRTLRRDRLRFAAGQVEVRFASPRRQVLPLGGLEEPLELGLVVPNTVDRRPRLLEIDEPSPRFRGLTATLRHTPGEKTPQLTYLGQSRTLEPGALYALGQGTDRMLLAFERPGFPEQLAADLVLYGLFVFVFLGPALRRRPALALIVGAVGLLLACRLLFCLRAASGPPDFALRAYAEARLSLWLVPAALVLGWALAWWLRRLPEAQAGTRASRWPVAGLLTAAAGCWLVAPEGNLKWLALAPALAAVCLWLLFSFGTRPGARERFEQWRSDGFGWRHLWLPACGLVLLAARWLSKGVGMPETLRLPAVDFRVLWTVIQLPICAVALALSLQLIEQRRAEAAAARNLERAVLRDWLGGIGSVLLFAALAFGAVALIVRDTGLVIAQSLPVVVALLLLVSWPRFVRRAGPPGAGLPVKALYAAGLLAACLPICLVLLGNARPALLVKAFGWSDAGELEELAELGSTRSQQLFRLYMLARPEELQEVGLKPSEQVAVHYDTLNGYAQAAGFRGGGYDSSRLPVHLGSTYLSDLVPMVFMLADFGVAGVVAIALLYAACLAACALASGRPPAERRRYVGAPSARLNRQGLWIAAVAMMAFSLPSLYMILGNLNLVLFTGKNCGLLALNSVSDVLESSAFLGLVAFGLGLAGRADR